jgi:septal ring factor EnvC (AmiA/AmiB activator)
MPIIPTLSDNVLYYIILTICITFTINYFVKLLFKHIDKDPEKITEYKNIINELTNKIKIQNENINSLNEQTKIQNENINSLNAQINKIYAILNKLSKKTFFS